MNKVLFMGKSYNFSGCSLAIESFTFTLNHQLGPIQKLEHPFQTVIQNSQCDLTCIFSQLPAGPTEG